MQSFSGRRKDSEFFFSFTSLVEPGATYRCAPGPPALTPRSIHGPARRAYCPSHSSWLAEACSRGTCPARHPTYLTIGVSARRVDVSSGKPEISLFRRVNIEGYNADDYVMKQLFVTSKDGTQVTFPNTRPCAMLPGR